MPQETKFCHSSALATFPFQGSGVEVVDESGAISSWNGSAYVRRGFGESYGSGRSNAKAAASDAWFAMKDQPLHVAQGSALDFRANRPTATPAGSLGRVVPSGNTLIEGGVSVKFNVCTWAADAAFGTLPVDHASLTEAVEHLARAGYNALRLHGAENYLMAYEDGQWEFAAGHLDTLDFFMSELKRVGIYWIINPASWNLGNGSDRWPTTTGGVYKSRIYVDQNIRDHWLTGMGLMFNRVNPYTGVNVLQDPALLMVEMFNESEVSYLAASGVPAVWLTREGGAVPANKTWTEWLSDPAMAHGYANIAALNASWTGVAGVPFADFAAAGAAALSSSALSQTNPAANARDIDTGLWGCYLESNLAAFYSASLTALNCNAMQSQHTLVGNTFAGLRATSLLSTNSVMNSHGYPMLVDGVTAGKALSRDNVPIWDSTLHATLSQSTFGASGKPKWFGEYGWPSWGKYRSQFVSWAALQATSGAVGLSFFHQGRFFEPTLKLDSNATVAQRFGRIFPYNGHGDPTAHFTATALAVMQTLSVFEAIPSPVNYITNKRTFGFPDAGAGLARNNARAARLHGLLQYPMSYMGYISNAQINYDDVSSTDDTYAATYLAAAHTWKLFQTENLPAKTVTAVAISGTVSGATATATAPILTVSGMNANTVTGDAIYLANLTGSGGSWPGTSLAATPLTVTVLSTTHVQVQSGLTLTGTSGFTAGTWTECPAHLVSMNVNSGNIVSVTTTGTVLGATASLTQPILVLGASGGSSGNTTLVTGDKILIPAISGTPGTWPVNSLRGAPATVTVLSPTTVQVTSGLNLTAGLSGANFTSGTWTEAANIVESRNREWGMSARLQRTWVNTPKFVFFAHGAATTFPVSVNNVTLADLTAGSSMYVASLDGQPITASRKLLVAMVGDAQSSGMTFTDANRKTIVTGGTYPIQASDSYCKFRVIRTVHGHPKITPLGLDGLQAGRVTDLTVDATGFTVEVQNSENQTVFWLVEV